MFKKVNLEEALFRARENGKQVGSEIALNAFRDLFMADWEKDQRIRNLIEKGCTSDELLNPENLDDHRLFSLDAIKQLAIKYRLRFLSTRHFKKEIPREAIAKIKHIEAHTGYEIKALMLLAPASMYKLSDANADPLLLAPTADGRFYLIHQWGGDLAWHRAILSWPLAKVSNLAFSIVAISLLIAMMVPTSMMSSDGVTYFNFYRVAFFAWNVLFISGFASFFWFATHQKFSKHAWNSKHFN